MIYLDTRYTRGEGDERRVTHGIEGYIQRKPNQPNPTQNPRHKVKVKLRRPRGTRPSGHIAVVGVSGPPFPDLGTW